MEKGLVPAVGSAAHEEKGKRKRDIIIESYKSSGWAYKCMYTHGMAAYSICSVGIALMSFVCVNGVLSFFSVTSFCSLLSLNSAFSIWSLNSAFAINCANETFKIC